MSLIETIRGFKEGNGQCLTYLFKQYGGELGNFISRSGFDKFEASIILQNVFHQAWKARDVFTIVENMSTSELNINFRKWLYWICNKQIKSYRRWKNSAKNKWESNKISLHDSSSPNIGNSLQISVPELEALPSAQMEHDDTQRRRKLQLQHLLEFLTPLDKMILQLRFFEEFSSSEIAEILEKINETTVRKRIARALKKLEEIIVTLIVDKYCQSLRARNKLTISDLRELFPVVDGYHQVVKKALEFEDKWFSAYSSGNISVLPVSSSRSTAYTKASQHFLHLKTYAQIAGNKKNAHLIRRKIYNFLESDAIAGYNKEDQHEPK